MVSKNPRKLIGTLLISTLLTACGGGGGGGGGGSNGGGDSDDRGTKTEVPESVEKPAFLIGVEENCRIVRNHNTYIPLQWYVGYFDNVTDIYCIDAALTDLTGIEALPSLEELELKNANLTNVDELIALTAQLKVLNLKGNPLNDLTAISQLTSLNELDLSNIGLEDPSSLVNLKDLTHLNLANNSLDEVGVLAALSKLEQLQLTGNDSLECSDVNTLADSLKTPKKGNVVLPPKACAYTFELGDSSESTTVIDNSTLNPSFDRVAIVGDYSYDDLLLSQVGNNLELILTADTGTKSITFTNWFAGNPNQVGIFEMPNGTEDKFYPFRDLVVYSITLDEEDDSYFGSNLGADIINGEAGKDTLNGHGGNDTLIGSEGEDILIGGAGADTLHGGTENDILIGGFAKQRDDGSFQLDYTAFIDSSADTYIYKLNDGDDIVVDYADPGTLVLGPGISATSISLSKESENLKLTINGAGSITIFQWFVGEDWRIKTIQFDDGSSVDAATFVNDNLPTL